MCYAVRLRFLYLSHYRTILCIRVFLLCISDFIFFTLCAAVTVDRRHRTVCNALAFGGDLSHSLLLSVSLSLRFLVRRFMLLPMCPTAASAAAGAPTATAASAGSCGSSRATFATRTQATVSTLLFTQTQSKYVFLLQCLPARTAERVYYSILYNKCIHSNCRRIRSGFNKPPSPSQITRTNETATRNAKQQPHCMQQHIGVTKANCVSGICARHWRRACARGERVAVVVGVCCRRVVVRCEELEYKLIESFTGATNLSLKLHACACPRIYEGNMRTASTITYREKERERDSRKSEEQQQQRKHIGVFAFVEHRQ